MSLPSFQRAFAAELDSLELESARALLHSGRWGAPGPSESDVMALVEAWHRQQERDMARLDLEQANPNRCAQTVLHCTQAPRVPGPPP